MENNAKTFEEYFLNEIRNLKIRINELEEEGYHKDELIEKNYMLKEQLQSQLTELKSEIIILQNKLKKRLK